MTAMKVIDREHFDELLGAIARRGYTIVGPTVREQAIVYDEISSAADLPIGWTDEQDGGHYRLRRRGDEALFGYAVGPALVEAVSAAGRGEAVAGAASMSAVPW